MVGDLPVMHRTYNVRAMILGEKTSKLSGNLSSASEAAYWA